VICPTPPTTISFVVLYVLTECCWGDCNLPSWSDRISLWKWSESDFNSCIKYNFIKTILCTVTEWEHFCSWITANSVSFFLSFLFILLCVYSKVYLSFFFFLQHQGKKNIWYIIIKMMNWQRTNKSIEKASLWTLSTIQIKVNLQAHKMTPHIAIWEKRWVNNMVFLLIILETYFFSHFLEIFWMIIREKLLYSGAMNVISIMSFSTTKI
jgi:hypothetical protein